MPLFQISVLKNYLKQQDRQVVSKAYKKYSKYFLNPVTQENIRNSKEEEFQALFLNELFVKVLGYTIKPSPGYNLTTEFKNETNNRKADGAIMLDGKALGVVELKGTKTKDLESIRKQAFDYKVNNSGCVYVITSNFEKLRFYIDDASNELEFNLFTLSEEEFSLLYLCLQKDNILNNIPLSIKQTSVVEEEKITKGFYQDYSLFKRELYRDLVKQNGTRLKNEARETLKDFATDEALREESGKIEKNVKLSLFKKSQKLIDRFLFIFFAEDRGLLPPNFAIKIINDWKALKEQYVEVSLYERFKLYFNFLDKGRKGEKGKAEVYAYNGGLFKPDVILDGLLIDDDMLSKHTAKLAKYDFESQVDVNILGHIFENSLNEIESVNAEIEGSDFDKQKSKRKKDGVFYTPSYITKYIVENTLGKLCEKKKVELSITYDNYKPAKQRSRQRLESLEQYREWLLQLTICDPACGSGAFLNQALDFLINEHNYIDELSARYNRDNITLSNIEHVILENNIYGVDLNEESVEIAKLSLWLRTAQPRRKLSNLSGNIKCGNSLIDSKSVAGDKAFNWEIAFPNVFDKGGFDVVIGNPPYGAKVSDKYLDYLQKYDIGKSGNETYAFFYEKGLKLIKSSGKLGFITPDTWLRKDEFSNLRIYLLRTCKINQLIETGPVFKDARDTWCLLIFIENLHPEANHRIHHLQIDRKVVSIEERQAHFETGNWSSNEFFTQKKWLNSKGSVIGYLSQEERQAIIVKLLKNAKLGTADDYIISRGEEGSQSKFDKGIRTNFYMVKPEQISKYHTSTGWYVDSSLLASKKLESLYSFPKLHVIRIQKMRWVQRIVAALDTRINSSSLKTLQIIVDKNKNIDNLLVLEAILNSRLINFWSVNFLSDDINSSFLKKIPLPTVMENENLTRLVKELRIEISKKYDCVEKFKIFFVSGFKLSKVSRKLENWPSLDFGDFIKELNKAIKVTNKDLLKDGLEPMSTLTKLDEMEWMDAFKIKKKEAQELHSQIIQTETEIDAMVYELYGLTEEEIKIVENSL